MRSKMTMWTMGAAVLMTMAGAAAGGEADFDDLVLVQDSTWYGQNGRSIEHGFTIEETTFRSGNAFFENRFGYNEYDGVIYPVWGGWAYTNKADTATPGFPNQFTAVTGAAHSGTNYGVAYLDTFNGVTPTVNFAQPTELVDAYVTNTNWAYNDMAGTFFGDDWFRLTITGKDAAGAETGSIEVDLAGDDCIDPDRDFILDDWARVDLSALGKVSSVEFDLLSTYGNDWGMLTPTYFAMDTLTTAPEPATLGLLALGAAGAVLRRRRR